MWCQRFGLSVTCHLGGSNQDLGEIPPNSWLVCCTFCSVMFSAWVSLSHLPSCSHVSYQCPTSLSLLLIHDASDCLDWCSIYLPTNFASGLLICICLPALVLTPMLTPGCLNSLLVLYIYGCIFELTAFFHVFFCICFQSVGFTYKLSATFSKLYSNSQYQVNRSANHKFNLRLLYRFPDSMVLQLCHFVLRSFHAASCLRWH